jgi:hydrogenase nickel incorporation protein HypB
MCATCGCSGTIGTEALTGPRSQDRDVHGHDHEDELAHVHEEHVAGGGHAHLHLHASGHGHTHEHGHHHFRGYHHVHDHGHGHLQIALHDHPHEHADAHSHDDPHEPVHVHEHAHDHGHGDHVHAHDAVHAHVSLHDHPHTVPDHDRSDTRGHTDADSTTSRTVQLEQEILGKNRLLAERNRGWLQGREIFAVNLMSSPGSGKTTLLERSIRDLAKGMAVSVVEGDQETRLDAERIRDAGARVVQINTGTGCHLDARMLERALHELSPPIGSLLFVENVGNLVCPALFDLGEGARVVIASTTEGEDKPLKYPHMFRAADVVLLNKVDLLPHLSFDVERFLAHLRQVNAGAKLFQISATRGDGLPDWYRWLAARGSTAHSVS